MMSLGSHVVEIGQRGKSDALELLNRDHLVLILVKGIQNRIDDNFGFGLVFFIVLQT